MSLFDTGDAAVSLLALKQSERGEEVVVRLAESSGHGRDDVQLRFAGRLLEGRELNGLEDETGPAQVDGDLLQADFKPYQVRTFAVRPASPEEAGTGVVRSVALDIAYGMDVVAAPAERQGGAFDAAGHAYSVDLFPAALTHDGVDFRLGPTATGLDNAAVCRGQSLVLPQGDFNSVHILAAADGDVSGVFRVGGETHRLMVQDYGAPIGAGPEVKPAAIAWVGTHRIDAQGERVPYTYTYLFHHVLPYDGSGTELTLPRDTRLRVFAVSVADDQTIAVQSAEVSPVRDIPARTDGAARLLLWIAAGVATVLLLLGARKALR